MCDGLREFDLSHSQVQVEKLGSSGQSVLPIYPQDPGSGLSANAGSYSKRSAGFDPTLRKIGLVHDATAASSLLLAPKGKGYCMRCLNSLL